MIIDTTDVVGDELHDILREAAAAGPTAVDALTGAAVVLRHADVERLSHDPHLAGVGLSIFDLQGIEPGPLRDWYSALMFTNEGPVHNRLRSLVSRAFTPRAVDALRDQTATLANAALADVEADGGGDLVDALALLPMRVMCRLLGVPDEDAETFSGWADDLSRTFGFMEPEQIEAAGSSIVQLLGYVDDLTTDRRGEPRDDLLSGLLAAEADGDRLTHAELVDMVANLLVGGHDTTASQIGCTLITLLRHDEAAAAVRAAPDLVASAVSETMRFEPSIPTVPRTATAPIEVGGIEVGPGALVFLSTAAANREASVWRVPDTVDVTRFTEAHAPRLLSFGAGPHYCLGAALARMTLEESVRATMAVVPALEPAEDLWQVPWRSVLGRSPARLPVGVG